MGKESFEQPLLGPSEGGAAAESAASESSQPFVERWDRLVSRTNWEKGRIIHDWRTALVAAEADVQQYSDEAWSRLVGGVTPQHVGRLRRTHERFHADVERYPALSWSHFLAALEWNDAELWLEGAKLNDWSISQMRHERWEKQGRKGAEPQPGEVSAVDPDEDVQPAAVAEVRDPRDGELAEGPRFGESDFGDEGESAALENGAPHAEEPPLDLPAPQRPFENLAALPSDLHEAVESFKLAILHHKLNGWSEVAVGDVVAALRALEQLATAPA